MISRLRLVVLPIVLLFLFHPTLMPHANAVDVGSQSFQKNDRQSNEACTRCHQQQHQQWQKSDHAKSMALANKNSVLADFNNVEIKHYGQKALFYMRDNQYKVTISYEDNLDTYPIKYTFGHFPLQQYLVETQDGKLQVLPFAWDARTKENGGQRWYHNYGHEEIRPEDRLHWRQPLQNWNGMCADCHSDGLKRNYELEKNTFDSQFDNINVGCLSCHGDMSEHGDEHQTNKNNNVRDSVSKPLGLWMRAVGDKTAHWQGEKRDNAFMDKCFSCHALRSPLTDGIDPNKAFLDQFTPQLLQAPMYHVDGQIKEEVYVYGSFLQSKMYAAGVNCLDCHDKHTMKLKIEDNGLCLQCHSSENYNTKSHHQHNDNSDGSQCVNCHMPTNRYMGVDDRRDHSFNIPRADVSKQFATPNACLNCHTEKNNQWAAVILTNWHGENIPLAHTQLDYMRLQSGQLISLTAHLNIIADNSLAVISRATALQMLMQSTQSISIKILKPYLQHQQPLIRLAAASVGLLLAEKDRNQYIAPLLDDKLKAIRVAAARTLVGQTIDNGHHQSFNKAFQELLLSNNVNSWRGEGRANQAIVAITNKDWLAAEKNYIAAITVDPYFEQAYTSLAELYRQSQQGKKSAETLKTALVKLPNSAAIHYAYGLHLVRSQKHQQAVVEFKLAHHYAPIVDQYLYTYALALDSVGNSQQALDLLIANRRIFKGNPMIKEMGTYLAQKLKNNHAYKLFLSW